MPCNRTRPSLFCLFSPEAVWLTGKKGYRLLMGTNFGNYDEKSADSVLSALFISYLIVLHALRAAPMLEWADDY